MLFNVVFVSFLLVCLCPLGLGGSSNVLGGGGSIPWRSWRSGEPSVLVDPSLRGWMRLFGRQALHAPRVPGRPP